jgi:hypothetical protein
VVSKIADEATHHTAGSFWAQLWKKVRNQPATAAAMAYFWIVAVGFAHLLGSGLAFRINVIDLASPSDFLVAALRDPLVILLAALTGILLFKLWGTFVATPSCLGLPSLRLPCSHLAPTSRSFTGAASFSVACDNGR